MRAYLLLTASALAVAASPAFAEDAATVDEVVVTATRLPARLDEVTGARVVDRAELEQRQTPFVADVLSTIPGVAIARNGAFGGIGAIRIRGAAPDKTLVLIDGVPVGDAADPNGTFDPSSLQTPDLERIEVLSGPQGSLWGSEAIGGVVSFTTRELNGWRAEAEAGSHRTKRLFAGVGTADTTHALSATVAGFRSAGISKADLGTEKDGFATATANLAGRIQLGQVKLEGRLRYTDSYIEIDGFAPPNFVLGDTQAHAVSQAWQGFVRASVGGHQVSASRYALDRKTFTAERNVLRWTWTGERFAVGAERQDSDADLAGRRSLDLSNTAVFGVLRQAFGPVTLTGSARFDDPEAYGSKTTGRLSAAAGLTRGFTITASAGTGFKTPTISQAVCDFCFAPPVELRPERAEGLDLRLGWAGERASAALTAYRLLVRDQIAYRSLRYVNIAKTRSSGLEAEADVQLTDAFRVKLAYAYTDAIDGATRQSLIRVPDHSGAAALFWSEGSWTAALTARAESSQSDTARDGFSRIRRKGFVTADLAGSYVLNERVTLTGRIENLADRRYQETFGYAEPGRSIYLGVRLRN